jgi:hypothetical protein
MSARCLILDSSVGEGDAAFPLTPALPMNLPVAADVRRRTPQPLSNPPPHVGGYGSWGGIKGEGERVAIGGGLLDTEASP